MWFNELSMSVGPMQAFTKTQLNIISLNVNSLISLCRRLDLSEFLKNKNPDILLLNETKLNPKHKLKFSGYNLIRKDRSAGMRGGGTAILIKENIKFTKVFNRKIDQLSCLETCIVKIHMPPNNILYIIAAYYPAGNNNHAFKTEFNTVFEALNLEQLNHYYILAEDLNSKHMDWGNAQDNPKGRALKDWLTTNELKFRCSMYASVSPSYMSASSFLDVCIADHRLNILKSNDTVNCLKCLHYDSDHNAIEIIARRVDNFFTLLANTEEGTLDYKKTNWKKFKSTLTSELQNAIRTPENRNLANIEIDHHLDKLNNIILTAIEKRVPKTKTNNITHNLAKIPVLKTLLLEKSKTLTNLKKYNRLQLQCSLSNIQQEKTKLKLIKKLIQENIKIYINNQLEHKLSHINTSDPSKISTVKKSFLKNQDETISHLSIPFASSELIQESGLDSSLIEKNLATNSYIIKNNKDVVDVIGVHFEAIHSSKQNVRTNLVHSQVDACFNEFLRTKTLFDSIESQKTTFSNVKRANDLHEEQTESFFILPNDLAGVFANLKSKLSAGLDKIPNIILKNLSSEIILEYCALFNNMLNNAYFPPCWKKAKMIVIPKKDKEKNSIKNLRPISLLPNISKVFEVVINMNINRILENNNLISQKQFGFKYRHSTTHAINLLVSEINWNWNKKYVTGACFLDIEKAFDQVWIEGLITKLIGYKFPLHLIILIYNMLCNRTFSVWINNIKSSRDYYIKNGLQQGTVNAPTLFNIYILDLLHKIDNIIAFADDVVIYHSDNTIANINTHLQLKYNTVEEYTTDWHLKLNTNKCQNMLFRPPIKKCNTNIKKNWKNFKIKSESTNTTIQQTDKVKYLGIYLDKFLYYNHHINNQIKKTTRAYYVYKKMFSTKFLHNRLKSIMYQALVRPILTYGCPIWYNLSPSYMERIRKLERRILRSCTSLYRTAKSNYTKYVTNAKVYNTAKVPRIDCHIINLIRRHIMRCLHNNNNTLIRAPYHESDEYFLSTIKKGFTPPETFLYLDKNGFIQNKDHIPIIYHIHRRANVKTVTSKALNRENQRFDTYISPRDKIEALDINKKCWWLNNTQT